MNKQKVKNIDREHFLNEGYLKNNAIMIGKFPISKSNRDSSGLDET